jgi:hypothetical protein
MTLKLINGPKKFVRLILFEFFLKVKWLNFRKRGGSIIAHMTEMHSPEFISGSSPANGKLCLSLCVLPPGMAHYRGLLASKGRQRYTEIT